MSLNKIIKTGLGVTVSALLLASCTKDNSNSSRADEIRDFGNMARVQIYNAALGTQRTFAYADAERLNGAAFIYSNTAHSGSGLTHALPAGLHAMVVRDTLGSSVQPQISFAQDFQANTQYTIFLYDTMNAIKQKTFAANIVRPTDGQARVRFANFAFLKGATPPNVDVFSKNLNGNLVSDVPYSELSGFMTVVPDVTDSLYVREAGTTTNLVGGAFTFRPNEHYTVVFRGRYAPGTTFVRTLASFINN